MNVGEQLAMTSTTSSSSKGALELPEIVQDDRHTYLVDFFGYCKTMQWKAEHVHQFFLWVLKTNVVVDLKGRMAIKGKYDAKTIENLICQYIGEYVKCSVCGGEETVLEREKDLYVRTCKKCDEQAAVAAIPYPYTIRSSSRRDV